MAAEFKIYGRQGRHVPRLSFADYGVGDYRLVAHAEPLQLNSLHRQLSLHLAIPARQAKKTRTKRANQRIHCRYKYVAQSCALNVNGFLLVFLRGAKKYPPARWGSANRVIAISPTSGTKVMPFHWSVTSWWDGDEVIIDSEYYYLQKKPHNGGKVVHGRGNLQISYANAQHPVCVKLFKIRRMRCADMWEWSDKP